MASIGHERGIDSIGETVAGGICRHAGGVRRGHVFQAENSQFHRICVSQIGRLDSDGRPRRPHRVMRSCQWQTGTDRRGNIIL